MLVGGRVGGIACDDVVGREGGQEEGCAVYGKVRCVCVCVDIETCNPMRSAEPFWGFVSRNVIVEYLGYYGFMVL